MADQNHTPGQSEDWKYSRDDIRKLRHEAVLQARRLHPGQSVRMMDWGLIIGKTNPSDITLQIVLRIDGREFCHNCAL